MGYPPTPRLAKPPSALVRPPALLYAIQRSDAKRQNQLARSFNERCSRADAAAKAAAEGLDKAQKELAAAQEALAAKDAEVGCAGVLRSMQRLCAGVVVATRVPAVRSSMRNAFN